MNSRIRVHTKFSIEKISCHIKYREKVVFSVGKKWIFSLYTTEEKMELFTSFIKYITNITTIYI